MVPAISVPIVRLSGHRTLIDRSNVSTRYTAYTQPCTIAIHDGTFSMPMTYLAIISPTRTSSQMPVA